MYLKHILIPAVLCIFLAIVNGDFADVDFCSNAYMCKGQREKHVLACNNNGKFDPEFCPRIADMVPMSEEFKQLFLDLHNKYRNRTAAGGPYFQPAAAMATLEWDDELAYFAELNIKRCQNVYEADGCFKTACYDMLDQNTDWVHCGKFAPDPSTTYNYIKNHIGKYWYGQKLHCDQGEINKYREDIPIEKFGRMVMDRNNRIGCAAAILEYSYAASVPFTCIYARRLIPNKPIYRSGKTAGSECKSGMNPKYKFLCSAKENVDPNNYK
ncbi:antigen 5 like allergen Cul n 1-like [Eurosta solidaginis]|uniref:antigen 5 like allergen Cul n 1-like n=1 Tax=Eurosta solidaginis TaxID=178769 RepID=UPI00353067D5